MSSVQKRIARIALVKTMDRATGIAQAIDLLKINPVANNDVLIKPNFNTADEFPGSTHNDTLKYLIQHVRQMGAAAITIGDRSGPADTDDVIREKGVDVLCRDLGVKRSPCRSSLRWGSRIRRTWRNFTRPSGACAR